MKTSQGLQSINIKGSEYVTVAERIKYFNEHYPDGSITPEIISDIKDDRVVIRATVRPHLDSSRIFIGHSQALWGDGYINKTSAIENCETSAIGRALGFMGIGVVDSIASVDEIVKAQNAEESEAKYLSNNKKATDKQINWLKAKANSVGVNLEDIANMAIDDISMSDVNKIASSLDTYTKDKSNE